VEKEIVKILMKNHIDMKELNVEHKLNYYEEIISIMSNVKDFYKKWE